ncbi:hypothetical protein CesoFtcFv8_009429 [Champsocephalus esox]|uniref:Uncharacterized protein n=1 Tax=Champsocephalus esox TaxID=159716 RepID=A0AAN8CEE4_9TELE|nr:hypothetical protein CesoFtcFv8_009429 [Champsocephalus esox]
MMDLRQKDEYLARDQRQTPTGHSGDHKGALGAGWGPGAAHGHKARDTAMQMEQSPPPSPHTPVCESADRRETGDPCCASRSS